MNGSFNDAGECPDALAEYNLDPNRDHVLVLGDGEMAETRLIEDITDFLRADGRGSLKIVVDANRERLTGVCTDYEREAYEQRLQLFANIMGVPVERCDGHNANELRAILSRTGDAIVIADTVKGYGLDGNEDLPPEGKRHKFVPQEAAANLLKPGPGGLIPHAARAFAEIVVANPENPPDHVAPDTPYISGPSIPHRLAIDPEGLHLRPIDEVAALREAIELADQGKRVLVESASPYLCGTWAVPRRFTAHLEGGDTSVLDLQDLIGVLEQRIESVTTEQLESLLAEIGERKLNIGMLGMTYVAGYGPPSDYLTEMLRYGINVIEPKSVEEARYFLERLWRGEFEGPTLVSITNLQHVGAFEDEKCKLNGRVNDGQIAGVANPFRGLEPDKHPGAIHTVYVGFGSMGYAAEYGIRGEAGVAAISVADARDLFDPEKLRTAIGLSASDPIEVDNVVILQASRTNGSDGIIGRALQQAFPGAEVELRGFDGPPQRYEHDWAIAMHQAGIHPREIHGGAEEARALQALHSSTH